MIQSPPLHVQSRFRWSVFISLLIGACIVAPIDVGLAKFLMGDPFPGELRSLIHKSEFFGHGYGILGIVFTIYLICEERRRSLLRLLVTTFAAGTMCNVVKMSFHRIRPVDFSFEDGASTFLGISFLHVDSLSQIFDSSYHSFPSAHTATAVAFAMALGAMFPKGARWFLVVASVCAISRFDGGAHYVSDTLVGGSLGYLTGCWMLGSGGVGNWFTVFEQEGWAGARRLKELARLRSAATWQNDGVRRSADEYLPT